jgi:hypothetical protein
MDTSKRVKSIATKGGTEIVLHADDAGAFGKRAADVAEEMVSNYGSLFKHLFFYDGESNPIGKPMIKAEHAKRFVFSDDARLITETLRVEYATVTVGLITDMNNDAHMLKHRLEDENGDHTRVGEELYGVIGTARFSDLVEILERLSHVFILDDEDMQDNGSFDCIGGLDERDMPKIKAVIGAAMAGIQDGECVSDATKEAIGGIREMYEYYIIATKALGSLSEVLSVLVSPSRMERVLNVDDAATASKARVDGGRIFNNITALKGPVAAYEEALDGIKRRTNADWIMAMTAQALAGLMKLSESGIVVNVDVVRQLTTSPKITHDDCETLLEYLHKNEDAYLGAMRIARGGNEAEDIERGDVKQ